MEYAPGQSDPTAFYSKFYQSECCSFKYQQPLKWGRCVYFTTPPKHDAIIVSVLMSIVVFYPNKRMKQIVVIPARLNSQRFPNKILLDLKGLPMIEHVRRRVLLAKQIR